MQEMLTVGKPYPRSLPIHEGAICEFLRPQYNRLLICIPNINIEERTALDSGTVTVKLHCDADSHALMMIFSFFNETGNRVLEFDSPFDASILPDVTLHNITDSVKRLAIEVVVVDTASDQITALRFITMSPALTVTFLEKVQYQLSSSFNRTLADKWINSQIDRYTPAQLADLHLEEHKLGV